jgi:hypothetical protein
MGREAENDFFSFPLIESPGYYRLNSGVLIYHQKLSGIFLIHSPIQLHLLSVFVYLIPFGG